MMQDREGKYNLNNTMQSLYDSWKAAQSEDAETEEEKTESSIRFRVRTSQPPKRTHKVYKLMRLKDGKLYPLYIDSTSPIELV